MKRDYESGSAEDIKFFKGVEVEKTPAFGKQTLFVTGLIDPSVIRQNLGNEDHIFFGANHSFNPKERGSSKYDYYNEWDRMIQSFLDDDYWCSLDIPIDAAEDFLDGPLVEYNKFIPQLRVPIPYIKQWNYNTMLKIDDKGFEESNPGVWCHNLHDLLDRSKFTEWGDYKNDKIVDDN